MNLRFRTRDNTTFALMDNYNTVGVARGGNELDLDIVEKTFNNGGVLIGERRLSTQELTIIVDLNYSTDTLYRAAYNEISRYSKECEYIEDTDNSLRTKVECNSIAEEIDETTGTILRTGKISITFIQLTPFWEDLTAQTDTNTGTSLIFSLNNTGYLDCPPTFTITASALCESILIYIADPVRGIEIQDLSFGYDTTLDEYLINCGAGTALLGDDQFNRNDRIRGGSGFFDFPVGSFTLNADFSVSCQCDISWRRRFFV
jgi:hypothetical protein